MSKGTNIAEEFHVVNILPPLDTNGAARVSDYFHVKAHAHVSIIVQLGVTGSTGMALTVLDSEDNAGLNEATMAYAVYKEETAAGDTLGVRTAVAAAGFTTSVNDSIMYVIEIDASELTVDRPYLVVKFADPTAATLLSAVAILSGSRYAEEQSATVIT